MHKAKKVHKKSLEKYKKSMTELESSIKNRDSAISNFNQLVETNNAPASAALEDTTKMSKIKSMMGSKDGPVTQDVINRLQNKTCELLKEFKLNEELVFANVQRYTELRASYIADFVSYKDEIISIEQSSRLVNVKEFMDKYLICSDLLVTRSNEALDVVTKDETTDISAVLDMEIAPLQAALQVIEYDDELDELSIPVEEGPTDSASRIP